MANSFSTRYDQSFVLVVGIDTYSHLRPLQGAVNDASAVAQLLLDKFGFSKENIFILLNQEATGQNILDHLEILS